MWWSPAGQTAAALKAAINGRENMAAEPHQETLGVSWSSGGVPQP
jgi:hypothetical protein